MCGWRLAVGCALLLLLLFLPPFCSSTSVIGQFPAISITVESTMNELQIRLKEYGSELLEVADNGHGVSPDNYQASTIAVPHACSPVTGCRQCAVVF